MRAPLKPFGLKPLDAIFASGIALLKDRQRRPRRGDASVVLDQDEPRSDRFIKSLRRVLANK